MKSLLTLLLSLLCLTAGASPGQPYFVRSIQPQGFTPSGIQGLAYWWNANDLTSSTYINAWTDRVQHVVFTNSLATAQPLYYNNGVWFNGNTYLTNYPGVTATYNGATFTVLNRRANAGTYTYLSWSHGGAAGLSTYSLPYSGDIGYWGSGLVQMQQSTHVTAGSIGIALPYDELLTICTARGAGAFTNGVATSSTGWLEDKFDTFGGTSPPLVGVGGLVGPIYEILIYTNLISSTDVSNLNVYAQQKWGTNGNPSLPSAPTITAQPSSITCLTNTLVSFSISATGSPSPSFQWQTNGVNLSNSSLWAGTTTSNLWVTNGSTLYANLQIQCIASNIVGSVTSSVAYLNVSDTIINGMVAWWRLDDGTGTTALDSSTNGNHGTLVNSPIWTNGIISGAVQFNIPSETNLISAAFNDSLKLTNNLSVSAWIKPDGTYTGYRTILAKRSGMSASVNYELFQELTSGKFGYFDGVGVFTTPFVPPSGQWSHVAVTVSGTTLKTFTNGWFCQQFTIVAPDGSKGTNVCIGAVNLAGAQYTEMYHGTIDDVRLYNRTLTTNEINDIYIWR